MDINVLVIDNSDENRTNLVTILEQAGISSTNVTSDFDTVVSQFSQGQYDAVLLDWNTSIQDDRNLVQELRETELNVPLFIISTEAETETAQETHGDQVTEYWTGTFDAEWLQEKFNLHLITSTS